MESVASATIIQRLPIALRIVLENLARRQLLGEDTASQIDVLLGRVAGGRLSLRPSRGLLDECADLPVLLELASLRDAVAAAGGNTAAVAPVLAVDLLIAGEPGATGPPVLAPRTAAPREAITPQDERREFLSWCLRHFPQLRPVPSAGAGPADRLPGLRTGIVRTQARPPDLLAYPEILVGTHARANPFSGVGIIGWGTDALELQTVLLGEPLAFSLPPVVGVELAGSHSADAARSCLALDIAEKLGTHRVHGKLVEFFGPGLPSLACTERATLAGLAPLTGALCMYFHIDARTLEILRNRGAPEAHARLVEEYSRLQYLWSDPTLPAAEYDEILRIDLAKLRRGMNGAAPARCRLGPAAGPTIAQDWGRTNAAGRRSRQAPRPWQSRNGSSDGRRPRAQRLSMSADAQDRYPWPECGMVLSRTPVFDALPLAPCGISDIVRMRPLAILGNAVTAEEISPSGRISADSPAAALLRENGVSPTDFGSYRMRHGSHEIALRATFAGTRLRNGLTPGRGGGMTRLMPERMIMTLFDAACEYQRRGVPLTIVAGDRYGCGWPQDWAARGVALLGIRVVIAQSFDPRHRKSLIGAGVLPLVFTDGASAETLLLDGSETFDLAGLDWSVGVRTTVTCVIRRSPTSWTRAVLSTAIDTTDELRYLRHGGVLPALWRERLGR